jgi:hypothetical protein
MDDFNIDITEALNMAARIVQTRLSMQAPVKTGKLKGSIKVYVADQELVVEYEDYGVFTNYGTGPYYNGRYGQAQLPGTFNGYVKGQGGIQAQNWSAITAEEAEEIDIMIEFEISRQIDLAIEKEISKLSI